MFKCFCWPSYDKNYCNKKNHLRFDKIFPRYCSYLVCNGWDRIIWEHFRQYQSHSKIYEKKLHFRHYYFLATQLFWSRARLRVGKMKFFRLIKFFPFRLIEKSGRKCIKVYNFLSLIYLCGIFYNHFLETVTEMHPLPFFLLRCQLLRGGHKKPWKAFFDLVIEWFKGLGRPPKSPRGSKTDPKNKLRLLNTEIKKSFDIFLFFSAAEEKPKVILRTLFSKEQVL